MKKTLRKGFLAVLFILLVPAVSSWAMGHHHHGGSSSTDDPGNGGGSSNGNDSGDGNGTSSNGNDHWDGNDKGPASGTNGTWTSNQTNGKNFPVAPVPEPMTMSLMATGVAGLLLRKRM